ncbi:hypothetical protein BJ165DRAFT_423510 [Panaeolus papilionaceus]|nr:hypothetical protein BJ165DRAFT_423510 [Panaeolus papilionaceus]
MVSRRESELEFLIAQPNGEPEDQKNAAGPSIHPRDQQLEEDVISMLDAIVLRNRKLDSEIRSLAKKLENARARAAYGRRSRENSTSCTPSRSANPDPTCRSSSSLAALPPPLFSKTNLKELEDDLRDLDSKITSFAAERRAIQRDLAFSHNPRHVEVAVGTETELQDDSASEDVNDEQDWDELISRLEDVTRERDRLLEENEHLREELRKTISQTAEHNEDTIMAGESLFVPQDEDVHPTQSTPAAMVVQHAQPVPTGNLLDSSLDEGEESMELATPLVPLVSLDDQSNHLETTQSTNPFNPRPQTRRSQNEANRYHIDPASIQLPDSPEEEVESEQAEADWDLDFANGIQLDIARFRSPPLPSPAPTGSLPGSPAISPTLTLASIRSIPASLTADLELDFSPSMIVKSTPLPALQPSPVISRRDDFHRRKSRLTPRLLPCRSSQRGSDEGQSQFASSTMSPGMLHMEMLLDGFGSDGHSVERETYEDT